VLATPIRIDGADVGFHGTNGGVGVVATRADSSKFGRGALPS
jgi:hypothetical protein